LLKQSAAAKGAVQKVLKVILAPQHKALIRVIDTICCGAKNPKQAFWTAPGVNGLQNITIP